MEKEEKERKPDPIFFFIMSDREKNARGRHHRLGGKKKGMANLSYFHKGEGKVF